jgi:hypothetical protein
MAEGVCGTCAPKDRISEHLGKNEVIVTTRNTMVISNRGNGEKGSTKARRKTFWVHSGMYVAYKGDTISTGTMRFPNVVLVRTLFVMQPPKKVSHL